MKLSALIGLTALPIMVFAQTPAQQARDQIVPALTDLGQMNRCALLLDGTETVNGITTNIYTQVSVNRFTESDGTLRLFLEIRNWRGTTETQRIAADGQRMWVHNILRNEYSVYQYDLETGDRGRQPAKAALNLLRAAKNKTTGGANMALQTLIEAEEAATDPSRLYTQWNPWMPTSNVSMAATGFRATLNNPRFVDMFYDISNPAPSVYFLLSVRAAEQVQEGNQTKNINWQIVVDRNTYPVSTRFTFAPPAGARPVSIGLPQGG